MGPRRVWLGFLLVSLAVARQPLAEAVPPTPNAQPVIMLTTDGLVVEWHAEWPKVTRRADGTLKVEMAGYPLTYEPDGLPLPFASILIALPVDGTPTLQLLEAEVSKTTLPGLSPLNSSPNENRTPPPQDALELHVLGVVRGVRLARLTFYPLIPTADEGIWRFTTQARVTVQFNNPTPLTPTPDSDPLLATVRAMVSNPTQVQAHINPPIFAPPHTPNPSAAAIEVKALGMTVITREALAAIGFPVTTTNPLNLHLTRAGSEIALHWEGDADALFESGERLLFFAAPRFSRWTPNDVYYLSADSTVGQRMTSRSANPTGLPAGPAWITQTVESNALYTPQCYCGVIPPGRDGDHWVWNDLTLSRPTRTYSFTTPTVEPSQPATLTVWMLGYTDVAAAPDHRVQVLLNNISVGHMEWDGKQAITTTLAIPAGVLLSGSNALTLTLPGLPGVIVEGAWLDAVTLTYARGNLASGNTAYFMSGPQQATTLTLTSTVGLRAYDVTNPDQPVILTDFSVTSNTLSLGDTLNDGPRQYGLAATDGLLAPARVRMTYAPQAITGADYVIITHPDFAPALTDLVALRETQGFSVVVEDVRAIYDSFGDGRPGPEAIRAYVEAAYQMWSPRPTYVLLVGDGTFDPHPYRATSAATFIPPYLAVVDPWMGETAADNRYVTVDGADNLPDLAIGRLPVNTLAEAQAVVNKIVAYETSPFPGGWNGNTMFVADDADSAGDFAADSELLITSYISAPFTAQRLYLTPPTTTITSAHQSLLNGWNQGAGLLVYTGHASTHQWAAERLFHNDDILNLANGSRLPVVLEMTCFTGTYHDPASITLDEALLRSPSGGAIAVWGATGFGVATGHRWLASGFMQSVYMDGQPQLGEATLAGKLALAASGQNFDLLDTFILLGDPALSLDTTVIPWDTRLLLPVIRH